MKNLFKRISEGAKKYTKYILGVVGVGALLSQVILPAAGLDANTPQFNFLKGDHELVRGANITKGEKVWKDPVSGEAGDVFEAVVYYHNGKEDTVAKNTKVYVDFKTETSDSKAFIEVAVVADNAVAVHDTIVDGKVVGYSGLNIALDQDAELAVVPNSVMWYPNSYPEMGSKVALPYGQTGQEMLGSNGLNLGDINGCWEFSGFVTFQIATYKKSTPPPTPDPGILSIDKVIREHIVNVKNPYSKVVSAEAKDKVEFDVRFRNEGDSDLINVIASDKMPAELSYDTGTLVLVKDGMSTPISADQFFSTGVNIGTMKVGEYARIHYRATSPNEITVAKKVVNRAWAESADQKVWSRAWVDLAPTSVDPGEPKIVKSKSAFNISKNVDAESIKAQAGDEIVYTLVTENIGDAEASLIVRDDISDVLEYADVIEISDGGVLVGGEVIWPEDALLPGYQFEDTFKIRVKNPIPENPQNGYSFDMVMYNFYGNQVVVEIEKPLVTPLFPNLEIEKRVRNITSNELTYVNANTAYGKDTLEYIIDFRNTGQAAATEVKLTDVLPANVTVDTSFAPILSMSDAAYVGTVDVANGVSFASLMPGVHGSLKFRVVIASGVLAGERLVNKACLTDNGVTICDTAETIVKDKIVPIKDKPTPTIEYKPLPKTGSNVALALIAALVGTGIFAAIREFRFAKANR